MFRQPMFNHIVKRFVSYTKKKKLFPYQLKKKSSKQRALAHFDDFYQSVYGPRWPGIRAALLTEHKYFALVNNFSDCEETKEQLEANGAVNIREIYERFDAEMFLVRPTPKYRSFDVVDMDKTLTSVLEAKKSEDIRAQYQEHSDDVLARLQEEEAAEKPRVIDTDAAANMKKAIEETEHDFDVNRIVSAEIGAMGLHEFIPATKLKGMEDFIPETQHYQYYSTTLDFPLTIQPEIGYQFPKTLDIYTYPVGDISRFNRPRRGSTGAFTHFLLDGASTLPALMLNVRPHDRVFDACAAPGGKSLIFLQSLMPEMVVCNDLSEKRTNRILSLFDQYLMDFEKEWKEKRCSVRTSDVTECTDFESYDKILVDVPCTTDRHSVMEDDNNIFKPSRIKERLKLPEGQAAILLQCLQLLKPGGSLVYSTCSLSPVQNDGVVHMALSKAFTDLKITVTIKDLTQTLRPLETIFRFENPKQLKYGQLILPFLPANFGPMYICKMTRNRNKQVDESDEIE